ncbi:8999_t:CDS:10 [Diversispora eburnea]|uniref:8999_t:CDS:1 n=1 Tax=Diversispora eburnea TaxID=1213867 RepID=A0A9N8Z137_9GLOM|nr:8999_t:CDS:10 [Diversispora eburnea]
MTESYDFYSYKTIEDFGYKFNEAGELRNIVTNDKFNFFVKPDDQSYNQRHYEALGVIIGEYIESELVSKFGLKRKIIPVGLKEDDNEPKSRIYLSEDALECQNLLLLIQGSGVVRPGQWARQVIMNESLELGSMYPYIQKAQELNWGIVVFNPNNNAVEIKNDEGTSRVLIPGSESLQEHCLYVWDKFINEAEAKHILIVAHSYGGISTLALLHKLDNDFKSRVVAIALTDSVHSSSMVPIKSKDWFSKMSCNWIKSHKPLAEKMDEATGYYGCFCVSAGHPKHEYTSGTAIKSVFDFLQHRLKKKMNPPEQTEQAEKTEKTEQKAEQQTGQQTEQQTENSFDAEGNKSNSDMDIDEDKGIRIESKDKIMTENKDTMMTENQDKIITENQDKIITENQDKIMTENQNNNSGEQSNQNNDSIEEFLTEVIKEQNYGTTEESSTEVTNEKTSQNNGFIEKSLNKTEHNDGPTEESSAEQTNQNNSFIEESSTEKTNQNNGFTEESSTEVTMKQTRESPIEINTELNQNNDDSSKEVHLVTVIDSSNESKNHITSEHTSEHDLNLQKSVPPGDITPAVQNQQQSHQPSQEEQSITEDINNGNEQSPDNANNVNIDQDTDMTIDINQEKDSVNNGNEHQQQQSLENVNNENNDQDINMSLETDIFDTNQKKESSQELNIDQDTKMSLETDIDLSEDLSQVTNNPIITYSTQEES